MWHFLECYLSVALRVPWEQICVVTQQILPAGLVSEVIWCWAWESYSNPLTNAFLPWIWVIWIIYHLWQGQEFCLTKLLQTVSKKRNWQVGWSDVPEVHGFAVQLRVSWSLNLFLSGLFLGWVVLGLMGFCLFCTSFHDYLWRCGYSRYVCSNM